MHLFPVYVVEDSRLARRTLQRQMEASGRSCRDFDGSENFLASVADLAPGIVLLDLQLGGMNGLDMLDAIGEEAGPFAVVVLSGSSDVTDVIGAFRRGAVHFLRKPYRFAELTEVLVEADGVLGALLDERGRRDKAATIHLSKRETQILQSLAQGHQSKQIAFELGISIRTVEMHRSHIIAKLGAHNASHALALARELGLV